MKKAIKIVLWSLASILLLAVILLMGFIYKVRYGFPVTYETDAPSITFPENQHKVLLFSKSTGFRHGESIEAGKKVFAEMAAKNNWFLYETESGGVFNADQLPLFDVVIFNNATGRLLNAEQQKLVEQYVEQGGSLVGIHGAGDNSHAWNWYVENLVGFEFSHHPLDPQLQEADVQLQPQPDSLLTKNLPDRWRHTDEWYVFFDDPRKKGFAVVYSIDGEKINPSGNLLWMKDKNFGMGKNHPVAWYKAIGRGRTFYTSIGHDAAAWTQGPWLQLLENAVSR